ncbi:hypothetical protein PRUB_a0642 [Pseudoalteromonas rubra]|uniref:Uncharacterized protein n=1 Tax=Pseudoalteromonas rubra TaxID=43658 RepID=A0A8T0C5Z5_9GAMM|nr:hypothetical protein PRUB_a0642 [Pseudoalteromonas rubra]
MRDSNPLSLTELGRSMNIFVVTKHNIKRIVSLYAKRMQIENRLRDIV